MIILQHNNVWKPSNQFLRKEVMVHAEKCPVCETDGKIEKELNGELVEVECHGCKGTGWVQVADPTDIVTSIFSSRIFNFVPVPFNDMKSLTEGDPISPSPGPAVFPIDTNVTDGDTMDWVGVDDKGNKIGINFTSSVSTDIADFITRSFKFSDKDKEKFK